MSFYTSLHFYRPGPPPILTGAQLAAFVARFASLGIATEGDSIGLRVKFGRAIDQDDRPTDWDEPLTPDGILSIARRIAYDAESADLPSLARLADALARLGGPIYRAGLDLGGVAEPVLSRVSREPSEENTVSLSLCRWALEAGPILSHALGGEAAYSVGWLSVAMHGPGYLYPWDFRGLLDRVESAPGVHHLMDLCRRTWPVRGDPPPRRVIRARRRMGELWPYDRLDLPSDWSWGLAEG